MSVNRAPVRSGISREEDFRRLERLPREVVEVYRRAPHDLGLPNPKICKDATVAELRAAAILHVAEISARWCAKTYGTDHPCHQRLKDVAFKAGVSLDAALLQKRRAATGGRRAP
jgi:hypothetical protein